MSKRRNKSTTYDNYTGTRDTVAIASRRLSFPTFAFAPLSHYFLLQEDRRRYHPDGVFRDPVAVPRSAARLVVPPRKGGVKSGGLGGIRLRYPTASIGFQRPSRVAICVKRKSRREVIFAIGRGGAGNRKGKRNYTSGFSCA